VRITREKAIAMTVQGVSASMYCMFRTASLDDWMGTVRTED